MKVSLRLAVASAAAVPMLLAFGAPAGASTTSVSAVAVSASTAAKSKLPKSSITTAGKFKPTKLSGKGHSGTSCSKKTAGAEVINKSTSTQQVTNGGAAFGSPIPAGGALYICYLEKGKVPPPTTGVFGLSGSSSTLTIKFT